MLPDKNTTPPVTPRTNDGFLSHTRVTSLAREPSSLPNMPLGFLRALIPTDLLSFKTSFLSERSPNTLAHMEYI